MKWNKAVEKIEKALAADKDVTVHYHRKWMKQDSHFDKVDSVDAYQYERQICKTISTYHDQIIEYSYIIDEVIIEN